MDWSELFEYRDGQIFWKVSRTNRIKVGDRAGCLQHPGYRSISLGVKRKVLEHRIIWEMHHGPIPDGLWIDHINRIRDDNRIENLRLCDKAESTWNRVLPDNKSGLPRGVNLFRKNGTYVARISYRNKRYCLGYFKTIEEASAAYNKKQKELHGEFANETSI